MSGTTTTSAVAPNDTHCIVEITTANSVHQISIPRRPRECKSPPLRNAVENLMKGGIFSAIAQQSTEDGITRGFSRGNGTRSALGDISGDSSLKKRRSRSTIMNMKKEISGMLAPLALVTDSAANVPTDGKSKPRATSPMFKVSKHIDDDDTSVTGGKSRLMLAAIMNDPVAVQQYIGSHGERTAEGKTALMFAAECGAVDCIPLLLSWEAGMMSNNGWTAMMYGIAAHRLDAVEILVQHKEELYSVTKDGRTPLILAAEQGCRDIVQLFVSSRLIGMKTVEGRTALMQAAWNRHFECVQLLADKESGHQDSDGKTALILTLEARSAAGQQTSGHSTKEFVHLLQSEKNKTMPDGTTALMCAAINSEEECIPLLTSELGKKQKTGRTALMLAAKQGTFSTLRDLLPEVGLKDGFGKSALYYAIEARNMTYVQELSAEYAMLGEDGMSMVMTAIVLGNDAAARHILNELLDIAHNSGEVCMYAPNNVPVTKRKKKTALMFAVESRSLELVEALAEVESTYQDSKGNTALMYAAELEFHEAVPILLRREEGMRNNLGHTALIQMAMNKNIHMISYLLSETCICDNFGMSALTYAAQLGHHEVVSLLLATDEVGLADDAGMTALMHAAMNGHTQCVSLLIPREHHYARMYKLLKGEGMSDDEIYSSPSFYSGHTALIVAAMYNSVDCVKQLIPWEVWVFNEHNRLPSVAIIAGTYSKDVQSALCIRNIHRVMKIYYAKRRAELGSCNICLNRIASMKCYPCNHVVCCEECAERLVVAKKSCPLCRSSVLFWTTTCYDLKQLSFTLEPNYEWINFPSDDDEDTNNKGEQDKDEDTDDELYVEIPLDSEIKI